MQTCAKNPYFSKRRDVIEYVTREDNLAFKSCLEARKIIRMALPGEKYGPIAVGEARYLFQNDRGAIYKASVLAKWGMWTPEDMIFAKIAYDGFEQLFKASYRVVSLRNVPFTTEQQYRLLERGFVDQIVFRTSSQVPGPVWQWIWEQDEDYFIDDMIYTDGNCVTFHNDRPWDGEKPFNPMSEAKRKKLLNMA